LIPVLLPLFYLDAWEFPPGAFKLSVEKPVRLFLKQGLVFSGSWELPDAMILICAGSGKPRMR
jgi:hypothetical protein